MAIFDRLKNALTHGWNAFAGDEQRRAFTPEYGGYFSRQDRVRMNFGNERTIISSIYTKLGMDAASVDIRHVRLDDQDRYLSDIDSGLNNCLTVEANIDQAARAFRQDVVMSLIDQGAIAIVPVDTTLDPAISGGFDVKTLRVGRIVSWFPQHVRVDLYNENEGRRQEITLEKRFVAIVENPLYTVMNEPNSTLQRLIRKLNMLDTMDEKVSSGKLDMIIQLPYVIKSEARREQAKQRRTDIEQQLMGPYGIAYTDGTEKITQLNRPVENNLLKQIEWLTEKLYTELGLTPQVMNGTADEATMKNYYNRVIEPIIAAVIEAMKRSFLTRTARSQKQDIRSFRDPFKLVPINELAEIADVFSRNEILSSNEVRQIIGIKPAADPRADLLVNSNMPQADKSLPASNAPTIDGEVVQRQLAQSALAHANRSQKTGSVGARKSITK